MGSLEEFEDDLQEALNHLYDPLYEPAASLWRTTGVCPSDGVGVLQQAIVRAIDSLEPLPPTPRETPGARLHAVLFYRYVQGLTQETAAERLGLSARYLRKQQKKAVHALAKVLWDAGQRGETAADTAGRPATGPEGWATQVQRELASLRQRVPGAAADVEATMRDAVDLGAAFTRERGIHLEMEAVPVGLQAAIHPSALRQMLLAGICTLSQGMDGGEIALRARMAGSSVCIEIAATAATVPSGADVSIIQEIVAAHYGSVALNVEGCSALLQMELPVMAPAPRARMLIIEDNADLMSFYRAYVDGMGFDILHAADGRRGLEMARTGSPDVIVLDIMLPDLDLDGWKLLVQLHGDPATRTIPVVVCSVVTRESDLALALGAAVCVAKPVTRHDFVAALQQALGREAA